MSLKLPHICILLALITIGILYSCKNERKEPLIVYYGNMVAVDTFGCQSRSSIHYSLNRKDSFYPVYFIGEETDTIYLNSKTLDNNWSDNVRKYRDRLNLTVEDSEMQILVDTTQFLCKEKWFGTVNGLFSPSITDSIVNYEAYPILIKNKSDSMIWIGSGNHIGFLTRQFLTSANEWQTLDSFSIDNYCIGNYHLYIKPKEVLLAKFIRMGFGQKVKQRLKFKFGPDTVYSNTFYDFMGKYSYLIDQDNL